MKIKREMKINDIIKEEIKMKSKLKNNILTSIIFIIITLVYFIFLTIFVGIKHLDGLNLIKQSLIIIPLFFLLLSLFSFISSRKRKDKLKIILDSIPELVFETNENNELTFFNLTFARTFGYTSKEALIETEGVEQNGKKVINIRNFYVNRNHRGIFLDEMRLRKGVVRDYFVYVKSKRKRPFYLSSDAIMVIENGKMKIRGIGRDMTSRMMIYGGFFQARKDGIITFCNQQFAKQFGYSLNNLIGENLGDKIFLKKDMRSKLMNKLRKNNFNRDWFVTKTKSDEIIMTELSTHSIRQGNLICGFEGTVERIQRSKVYVIQDGKIVYFQDGFSNIFGYNPKELKDINYLELVADSSRELVMKNVEKKIEGDFGRIYEFRGIKKDKSEIKVLADSAIGLYGGRPAVIGYVIEATPSRDVEERLKQRERFSAIGEAASEMAHWIANKIRPMIGCAERIEEDIENSDLSEEIKESIFEDIYIIKTNAEKTLQVKNDLIRIEVPTQERELFKKTFENFHDIITDVIKSLIPPDNVDINIDIDPRIKTLKSKEIQLSKVFTYIIKNAFEAMPDGGKLEISGKFNENTNIFEIKITDTGCGIPEKDRNMIFKPFWSSKSSTSESGTGLGLWYCINALDAMGADIDCESQEGMGTTFILTFFSIRGEDYD